MTSTRMPDMAANSSALVVGAEVGFTPAKVNGNGAKPVLAELLGGLGHSTDGLCELGL